MSVKKSCADAASGAEAEAETVRSNVTLPPIDATPEEIVLALFQRPPLKKPKAEDSKAA